MVSDHMGEDAESPTVCTSRVITALWLSQQVEGNQLTRCISKAFLQVQDEFYTSC